VQNKLKGETLRGQGGPNASESIYGIVATGTANLAYLFPD
jgi:hypothetical protein